MTDIDYSTIEHLDFDIEEEAELACYGYRFWQGSVITQENKSCPNKPKLIAVRGCCGMAYYYCLDCYNYVCKMFSTGITNHSVAEGVDRHRSSKPTFSQVNFL